MYPHPPGTQSWGRGLSPAHSGLSHPPCAAGSFQSHLWSLPWVEWTLRTRTWGQADGSRGAESSTGGGEEAGGDGCADPGGLGGTNPIPETGHMQTHTLAEPTQGVQGVGLLVHELLLSGEAWRGVWTPRRWSPPQSSTCRRWLFESPNGRVQAESSPVPCSPVALNPCGAFRGRPALSSSAPE